MAYKDIPKSVQKFMEDITQKCGDIHADWAKNFTAAFANTLLTTVKSKMTEPPFIDGRHSSDVVKRLYCTSSSLFSDCKRR